MKIGLTEARIQVSKSYTRQTKCSGGGRKVCTVEYRVGLPLKKIGEKRKTSVSSTSEQIQVRDQHLALEVRLSVVI